MKGLVEKILNVFFCNFKINGFQVIQENRRKLTIPPPLISETTEPKILKKIQKLVFSL